MEQEQFEQARLNHAAGELHAACSELCRRHQFMDKALPAKLKELVDRHRQHCKWVDGIDFPEMHVLLFPRLGAVELVRKDWERKAIEIWIVNCTVKYPNITAVEIAAAVAGAWPSYVKDVRVRHAMNTHRQQH